MNQLLSDFLHYCGTIFSAMINDAGHLHPLVVHFPIAIFLTAPLLLIPVMFARKSASGFRLAFLIMLWLGTVSLWAAYYTGELAAESLAVLPSAAMAALAEHDRLAGLCRLIFSILTVAVSLYFGASVYALKRSDFKLHILIIITLSVAYAAGVVVIVNAAHQGGVLVHRHGISSPFFSAPASPQ